jgi:hypothetical protein
MISGLAASNIGYPPAGMSAMTMIYLYLKARTPAQIIGSHTAGG